MVVLAHPTGNTFVRATARALHDAGLLAAFHTTVVAPGDNLLRPLPDSIRRQILRRRFDDVPPDLVHTHPWPEVIRLTALAIDARWLTSPGAWACIDAVYERFDGRVARDIAGLPRETSVSSVYAYEDAALRTFRAAHGRGLACIYELPIAYWETTQRLLKEEAERLPEWSATLHGIDDSPEKLERKSQEINLADAVVVPSRFVLGTLPPGIRRKKPCIVAPFGSPEPAHGAGAVDGKEPDGRLRVLFAGSMTQRKGLADLFAAMRLLHRSDVELVVMGSLVAPLSFYREQYPDFTYEPPRPHDQVLALMRSCHILALPAIVEGRALVQQEALANGLPIIVTANAGGEDLVEDGRTGFLVPIRSPEAIAERIAWFADHRELLAGMRACALQKAADKGWSHYEAQVREAVKAAAIR